MRLYHVLVDDPDMAKAHELAVPATGPAVARHRAARLAVLLDGRGPGIDWPDGGKVPWLWRLKYARDHGIVSAVANYAVIRGGE